jgi:hypothetical protein
MLAEASAVRTREVRPSRSVIKEAKTLVPTLDLADRLWGPGQMRKEIEDEGERREESEYLWDAAGERHETRRLQRGVPDSRR